MKISIRKILIEKNSAGKNRLNKKISIFLFCLAFASIFWLLNALSKNLTLDILYPFEYEYYSDRLLVVNKPTKKLKIFASGSGFNLLGQYLVFNREPLSVSLTDLEVGENGFATVSTSSLVDEISNQLGSNIQVQSIYPTEIRIQLAEKVVKTVPVKVAHDFTFSPQTRLKDSIIAVPNQIKVSGPQFMLDSISYVQTIRLKRKLNKSLLLSGIDLISPLENDLVTLSPNKIDLNIAVEEYTESTLSLPIQVIDLPSQTNFRVLPSSVMIKFLVPLELYDDISADNFTAMVDYKEVSRGNSRLIISVTQKENLVEIIAVQPERAEYLIKK